MQTFDVMLLDDATPQQLLTALLSKDKTLAEEFNTALHNRNEFASLSLKTHHAKTEDMRICYAQDATSSLNWGKQTERRVIDRCIEILCSW